ncbi:MAG: YciI family protein [Candidatus Tectomicrobia bacterium]
MKRTFVILYNPGPAWIEGKPVSEQPLQGHVDYMHGVYQTGALLMGGPFADNTGGLVVLDGVEKDEAQSILSQDPAVIAHVLTAELHLWNVLTLDSE